LLDQWHDISGNAKFAIVTLIGGGIVTAAIAITHGLQLWQQIVLASIFGVLFAIAVVATYAATRQRVIPEEVVSPENVHQNIRDWLDAFRFQVGRLDLNWCHFGWSVTLPNTLRIWLLRTRIHDQYITLMTSVGTEAQRVAFNGLTPAQRLDFWRTLFLETSRSRITVTRNPNDVNTFGRLTIERLLPITNDLNESAVIEAVRDIDFSAYMVHQTVEFLLIGSSAAPPLPSSQTETPPASATPPSPSSGAEARPESVT
jgi:hypothetical protein